MKGFKRSVIIVAVLLVIAVGALQVILKNHLGEVIDRQVVPAVEDELRVDVEVADASVNLLGGAMDVSGVQIANPDPYAEPSLLTFERLALDVGIKNLLMGNGADISELRIDDASLTIVRNADGSFNIVDVFKPLKKSGTGGGGGSGKSVPRDPAPEDTKEEEESGLPGILIREGQISTTITYIDHALSAEPLEIRLQNRLEFENVGTRAPEDQQWGSLHLTGSLTGDRELSVADLRGRVAPIPEDPLKASFDLSGTISRIDTSPFTNEMRKADFRCDALSLELSLACRDGAIDPSVSSIRLVAHGFEPLDKLARRLPDAFSRIERLSVPLAVSGPLSKPKLGDFSAALFHAFASLMQENPGDVTKKALNEAIDGRDTSKLLDKAGLDDPEKEQIKNVLKGLLGTSDPD